MKSLQVNMQPRLESQPQQDLSQNLQKRLESRPQEDLSPSHPPHISIPLAMRDRGKPHITKLLSHN